MTLRRKTAEEPSDRVISGVGDAHGHGADHTQQADIHGRPPGARGRRFKVRTTSDTVGVAVVFAF